MSQDDLGRKQRHLFDADRFLDGFSEEEGEIPVDPESSLGQAMTRARESWGPTGLPDPDEFVFPEPIPVDLDE